MQSYYAVHLPLPVTTSPTPHSSAVDVVRRWVAERFATSMEPPERGGAHAPSAHLAWSTLTGEAGDLFGLAIDHPDAVQDGWHWRTYVDVGTEDERAWFRVRVHLYSEVEGVVTDPGATVERPDVVRLVVDELGLELDGRRPGIVTTTDASGVDAYLALLHDPQRRLPVIALSTDRRGHVFVDEEVLADRLAGLAHVVVLQDSASWAVSRHIGKPLSCYLGAVRVYWPGFAVGDDRYHHRLYTGGVLDFLGPQGLERELFSWLGRLAGLAVGEPPLRRRLIQEAQADALERSVAARVAAATRVGERRREDGSVSTEEFAAFAADFDAVSEQLEGLEFDLQVAHGEIERLRGERDAARASLTTARRIGGRGGADLHPAEDPPRSVLEAVRRAAESSPHVDFLGEAYSSARSSEYGDPGRVLEDLTLIEDIAREWNEGSLPQGPHQAFKLRCSAYRDGISSTAEKQYAKDYWRTWNDEKILLGPHIRRGTGPVATLMRIYFYLDTAHRRIVVGHVGRKLRDTSNRN